MRYVVTGNELDNGMHRTVRIVAIGDIHFRTSAPVPIQDELRDVAEDADIVLLTGDLTDNGRLLEVESLAEAMSGLAAPVFAVLGNHDRRTFRRREFRRLLSNGGVQLLDGDSSIVELDGGLIVGVVGVGGYGGGFWPDETPDMISARLSQTVAVRARREAARLEAALESLANQHMDLTIVNMHYAPTTSTLGTEPMVKHWMLGNSILGRVIDRYDVSLVVHGHAHLGNYHGRTPGGTPVRNVALPVVGHPVSIEVGRDGIVRDSGPVDDGIHPSPVPARRVTPPR